MFLSYFYYLFSLWITVFHYSFPCSFNFTTPMNLSFRKLTTEAWIFLGLCTGVMAMLVARAILVPFSHDEATTFFNYVQSVNFIPFLAKGEANNHFLNSFITFIFFKLFGSSVLALRLSNLVFAPLYFYFCYKLSREISSVVLRWVFLPVMIFTFHMIEFFALTRGYGLSLTFFTGAVWQVFQAAKTGHYRNYLFMVLFMLLSSLSILMEIYNFTLLLAWSLFMIFYLPGTRKLLKSLLVLVTGAGSILFLVLLTLHLQKGGAYIEMGPTGLWDATLRTLFSSIIEVNYFKSQMPLLIFTIVALLPLLVLLVTVIIRKKWRPDPNLLFPYLLAGNLLIIIVVVNFFFKFYPESRLVLFLFPITIGSAIFSLDLVIRLTGKKLFFILAFPLLFFPLQSFSLMNFEYITWYNRCHIPDRYYNTIMADYKPGDMPPTIAGHGTQAWAWQFLARQHGGVANEMITLSFPNKKADYEIVDLQYFGDFNQYYDTIDYDPVSRLSLLKRKKALTAYKFSEESYGGSTARTNSESSMILERNVSLFRDKTIRLDFDYSLSSFDKILYGSIAIAINDSSNQNLLYDEIHLNWIREHWDGSPHNLMRSWIMPELPPEAAYMKVYLWNIGKTDYAINRGTVTFYELK